jgi:phosphoribosylanthranilate isomerase
LDKHRLHLKICGMLSTQEVSIALAAGASHLGFVGEGLTPPGCLSDEEIVGLTSAMSDRSPIVLLTPHGTVAEVVAQQGRVRAGALQLCHPFEAVALQELRVALADTQLIQVVHMGDPGGRARAREVSGLVDVVLLDSGSTQGIDVVYGGTGRVHDWRESAAIVAELDTPVWLAGGLRPSNVTEAIELVGPAGLDVCSGLRHDGKLVAALARDFVLRAEAAL